MLRNARPPKHVPQPEIIDFRTIETKVLGQMIVERRKELSLTQLSLARSAEITPAAMCRIEKGQSRPMESTLTKICAGLDCSLTQLIYPVGPRQGFNKAISLAARMGKQGRLKP